jgi:hypothetical protein
MKPVMALSMILAGPVATGVLRRIAALIDLWQRRPISAAFHGIEQAVESLSRHRPRPT